MAVEKTQEIIAMGDLYCLICDEAILKERQIVDVDDLILLAEGHRHYREPWVEVD